MRARTEVGVFPAAKPQLQEPAARDKACTADASTAMREDGDTVEGVLTDETRKVVVEDFRCERSKAFWSG